MTLDLNKVGAPMNTMKLFFAVNILGFVCLNMIAMQDQEELEAAATPTPASAAGLHRRIPHQLEDPQPDRKEDPEDIDDDQEPAAAPVHDEEPEDPAAEAPAEQVEPAQALLTLKEELTASHNCVHQLVTHFNYDRHLLINSAIVRRRTEEQAAPPVREDGAVIPPVADQPERPALEAHPSEIIHRTLNNSARLVRQLIEHYNPDAHAQELAQNINDIRQSTDQLALLSRHVDILFDETRPIVNQHLEHVRTAKRTIAALRHHFRQYIRQGIDDEEQTPLENADRNLTREINAFFQFTQNRLNEAHRSIDTTLREIDTLSVEITAAQQMLEKIAHTEQLMADTQGHAAKAAPQEGEAQAPEQVRAVVQQQSYWRSIWGGVKAVTATLAAPRAEREKAGRKAFQATGEFIKNKIIPNARLVTEPVLHTSLRPANIPQELGRAHETLEKLITRLDETLQRFRTAAATEAEMKNNLQMLCTILDSHDNPHFQLRDQDQIERSLATSIVASNLRTEAIRWLFRSFKRPGQREERGIPFIPNLETIISRIYPETTRLADQQHIADTAGHEADEQQPIAPRQPKLPILGRLIYGARDSYIGARDKVGDIIRPRPADPRQPARWPVVRRIIDQVAPELPAILAARNAQEDDIQPFGQKTFDDRYTSWLINTQNPNYLLYDIAARTRFNTGRFSYLIRPFVHDVEEGYGFFPRRENEQPGERYDQIMHALADESTPLEHPWLLFSAPPSAVRGIENILRVAHTNDEPLPPAPRQLATANAADAPFTSTSFTGFIWNGLKRIARWPARKIGPILVRALSASGNAISLGARMITAPFINRRPIVAFGRATAAIKNYIARKIQEAKVWGAIKIRFMLAATIGERAIQNLERNIREGHPASERLAMIQELVANHQLEVLTRPLQAAIAHNHQRIRAFAQKYENIQRIDPIIPKDPITRLPIHQEAVIHDDRLRTDLGSFVEGWTRRPATTP